jgi:tetratricopeptide (TPR) repeat protein
MSLLLDARKKSQESGESTPKLELSLEATPSKPSPLNSSAKESARSASQNLFLAKTAAPSGGHVNRNLLYALLGSIVLFALGAVYVWYEINSMSRPAARPVAQMAAITPPAPTVVARMPDSARVTTAPAAEAPLVPQLSSPAVTAQPSAPIAQAPTPSPARLLTPQNKHTYPAPVKARAESGITVSRDASDNLDTQLNNAYQAYKAGKYEQAQLLYRSVLAQEPRNVDSLLGLAAIAQQTGADTQAQYYYSKVLSLDPRNSVANAGMSALSTDENRESRLKMLLNEQKDSSSLHFALGNQYASQQRWAEAQQSYFNAYQLEPNNATLAFNLAISLERLGQSKPSAQYYRRAIALDKGKSAGFDHAAIEQHAQTLAQ